MKLVLTPDWFLGKDVMIEGFSFLVLLTFFILCYRYYKLSKEKNLQYLGFGFLLIALAQLATITTKLILYYDTTFTQQIGQYIVTYHFFKSIDFMYYVGFFFYKLLTLAGLYILYRLPKKSPGDIFLAVYFILVSALFGTNVNFVFHLTVIIFLILIIRNYWSVYKQNKLTNTKILLLAFGILALGHMLMIIPELMTVPGQFGEYFMVLANFVELVSYVVLLILIIRMTRIYSFLGKTYSQIKTNGKKKK